MFSCFKQRILCSILIFQCTGTLIQHFAKVGNRLATKLSIPPKHHLDYVDKCKSPISSFLFQPVLTEELRSEILLVPNDKSYGLYFSPTKLLKCSSAVIVVFPKDQFLDHCFSCYMSMISTDAQINFGFYLFADDTNILYADKNLKDLETIVNNELQNLYDWLTANKLTLNINKSNFVIFIPTKRDSLTNQNFACLIIKKINVFVSSRKLT